VRAEVVRRSRVDTVGNSYRAYLPPGRARGLLVLLPGYGSNVDSYELGNGYTPSGLPARLAARGIATAAGACGGNPPVAAVFAVDAPLDFAPVWREADLSIRRGSPRANLDEARGLLDPPASRPAPARCRLTGTAPGLARVPHVASWTGPLDRRQLALVIVVHALLDAYIPAPDVQERHEALVRAAPAAVWDALWRADLGGPVARTLLALRVLPAALLGGADARRRLATARRRALTLQALTTGGGFALLAQTPTAVVFGLTGRFWTLGGGVVPTHPTRWNAGPPPGLAQAAWSFEVWPAEGGRAWLVTETRVRCADAATRRTFARYWRVVRPGSGLLRGIMLRRIRQAAERRPGTGPGAGPAR
jgi:hypothetical protein